MDKLTNVFCSYSGGGIYVYHALYNGKVWISSDLAYYGSYDVNPDLIESKYNCDYDSHWVTPDFPLPTWAELLDSIRQNYGKPNCTNLDLDEVERILRNCHPNLDRRLDEQELYEPSPHERNMETICQFIEAFEDFLDEKGIVIPNDEKEQSPDTASNIYGTDYGNLSDRIEKLLRQYNVLEEE